MSMKQKGSGGENEFCEWLKLYMELEVKPKRILGQARDGGADVRLDPFLFEVKRREVMAFKKWWDQVGKAAQGTDLIPVVAFRPDRGKWEFLIPASEIGVKNGFLHINRFVFRAWAGKRLLAHDG